MSGPRRGSRYSTSVTRIIIIITIITNTITNTIIIIIMIIIIIICFSFIILFFFLFFLRKCCGRYLAPPRLSLFRDIDIADLDAEAEAI